MAPLVAWRLDLCRGRILRLLRCQKPEGRDYQPFLNVDAERRKRSQCEAYPGITHAAAFRVFVKPIRKQTEHCRQMDGVVIGGGQSTEVNVAWVGSDVLQ